MANYSCKKYFSTTLSLATMTHSTSVTDGRTERWRQPCQ